MNAMSRLYNAPEPIPLPDEFCKPVKVFEWPRIIAVILLCFSIVGVAEYMRIQTADSERRALSTEGRLLLSLADTNTGLIDVRPATNEIAFASKEATGILGYGEQELAHVSINKILPSSFWAVHEEKMRLAMQSASKASTGSHVGPNFMECTAIRKDGTPVEVSVRVFVSRNGVIALLNLRDEVRKITMPPLTHDAR